MEAQKEIKHGTEEELRRDLDSCGFREFATPMDVETAMALTRTKLDTTIRKIIGESGLSLSLFDYVLTSVLSDIRKADADTQRINSLGTKEIKEKQNGDSEQAGSVR